MVANEVGREVLLDPREKHHPLLALVVESLLQQQVALHGLVAFRRVREQRVPTTIQRLQSPRFRLLQCDTVSDVVEIVESFLLVAELGRHCLQLVDSTAELVLVGGPIRVLVFEDGLRFGEEGLNDFIGSLKAGVSCTG